MGLFDFLKRNRQDNNRSTAIKPGQAVADRVDLSSDNIETENIRVYFSRPTDIEPYGKLIVQAYQSAFQSLQEYLSYNMLVQTNRAYRSIERKALIAHIGFSVRRTVVNR